MEVGKGPTKVAWENILSCHQRCVRATVAAAVTIIATLMILHLSVSQLVPPGPSLSTAPRDVSRVEIVLAVIVNATDAGKCGYNNLCTCNDRQQSVKEHQPVPTTSNPSPSPYPSGTQKPNLNPNLIPKRVTTVFCQLVRLMCNEMPCVCVSACVCECLSVLLKGLCVCALPTRSP